MKTTSYKRVLAVTLSVFLAFFLYVFLKLLPDIYTNMGKENYEAHNYSQAAKNLKFALNFNFKNTEARYYYVQSLLKMPITLEVQKELFEITQANLSDSADLIAQRQISKWRNQIISKVGENYIEKVPMDSMIVRWDSAKMPLKIYFKDFNSAPSYYQGQIQKAFAQWQFTGVVSFDFVQNEKDANIVIALQPLASANCSGADCKYVVAYTTPEVNGDILQKMTITFYNSNAFNKPFSQREVYNTALHEIGHSLGIMGHSEARGDIMFMETNQDALSDDFRNEVQKISQSDINTLSLLYKLTPEITNTSVDKFNTSRQFYAPIVLGSDELINSRKIEEAQKYIEAAPNLPNGYIDLSAAYSELKEYAKAIDALNKAYDVASNDMERFAINYNLAIIYTRVEDWNMALDFAQKAKSLQNDSEVDGLIASIYFNKGERNKAKALYEESLAKNPSNTIDAVNLARIYLKDFNLAGAGKTLNKLISANPEAANDSRVKAFGLITFLFR